MTDTGPDEIRLGEHRAPHVPDMGPQARRLQEVRLEAMKMAVLGTNAGLDAKSVVKRAQAYVEYILNAVEPEGGRTEAFVVKQE